MPEVMRVRRTDDVEPPEPFDGVPAPRWRRVAAFAVLGVLALAGAYALFVQPHASTGARRAGAPAQSADAETVAVAQAALDGWGQFAVTGDLHLVAALFDARGPQFARLREESAGIAAHPPGSPAYSFRLVDPVVVEGQGAQERIVRGDVTVSRPGEAGQHFTWDVVLRRGSEERWSLWTVRDKQTPPGQAGVPTPAVGTS